MVPITATQPCFKQAHQPIFHRVANEIFVDRYKVLSSQKYIKEKIQTVTLDRTVFELNNDDLSYGEIIKIDTQGTELEILKAGLRTLTQRTYAIMTEVSFAELYKGQALFSDVESFLRPLGFKFYGFDLFRNRSLNFLDKKVNWVVNVVSKPMHFL